jgi:aminoglycoside phosphotransferase (APT) family kinase protein
VAPRSVASRFESLTADAVCDALREAGISLFPFDVTLEQRDERWAVTLPGDRMAWFPSGDGGLQRLSLERRVLRLLAERCTFRAPKILYEQRSGFDVRAIVPGQCDPWPLFERAKQDEALARRIGRSIGAILVEQHTLITAADVTGWLPDRLRWPEPSDSVMQRIADIVSDRALVAAIGDMLEAYDRVSVAPTDRVLVHGDLGLHNIVMHNDDVVGVFDYDGATWADRHHDFRYLTFLSEREEMLEAALEVYEPAVGRKLNRRRIELYNAASAASFLAARGTVSADERPAGRSLAEDLGWICGALVRLDTARE